MCAVYLTRNPLQAVGGAVDVHHANGRQGSASVNLRDEFRAVLSGEARDEHTHVASAQFLQNAVYGSVAEANLHLCVGAVGDFLQTHERIQIGIEGLPLGQNAENPQFGVFLCGNLHTSLNQAAGGLLSGDADEYDCVVGHFVHLAFYAVSIA